MDPQALTFPIGLVLLPFALFFVVYALYSGFSYYHLARFGVQSAAAKTVMVAYAVGSALLLLGFLFALLRYDLTFTVTPFQWLDVASAGTVTGF